MSKQSSKKYAKAHAAIELAEKNLTTNCHAIRLLRESWRAMDRQDYKLALHFATMSSAFSLGMGKLP